MSAPRTFVRPMAGWWRRNPYYLRYMLMETTSLAVAIYAVILLAGLWLLGRGPEAFEAWLEALRHPLSIVLHAVLLLALGYHAYTWWKVLPKTLPLIHAGDRLVPGGYFSAVGWAATLCATALLFAAARWW